MAKIQLFTQVHVGSQTVKNRVWMPPMCQYSAVPAKGIEPSGNWLPLAGIDRQGAPTQWHLQHYTARALGGVGAVIVEATGVTPQGRISSHCMSLHEDALIPAFAELANAIHEGGAQAYLQIVHSGRKGSRPQGWADQGVRPLDDGGWELSAPSPIPFTAKDRVPRELTAEEIAQTVEDFAQCARRAIAAGFDGVQVHAAHGYLIHQFLSPLSNERDDQWGGDFEGRTRFMREVTRAVRGSIGDAALLVRISATDWLADPQAPTGVEDPRHGWTIAETQKVAPLLVEDGADMICVSTGGNVMDAPIPAGPSYQLPAAAAVKRSLISAGHADIPVSAVGLIHTAEQAEQALLLGAADVIEIGRPLLTDPTLAQQWRAAVRSDAELPAQYKRGIPRR